MMLIAIIWAVAAPLLLVAVIAGLALVMRRLGRLQSFGVATMLVCLPVVWIWNIDHRTFEKICRGAAHADVRERALIEGFLLDSGSANSFGMRYLHEEGFDWIEARDIGRRDGWVRFEKDAQGQIKSKPIDRPMAAYAVVESFEQPNSFTRLSVTTVLERGSGRQLARAGSATFDGRRTRWVLGAWGVDSCPRALTSPNAFRDYYHLARNTLR